MSEMKIKKTSQAQLLKWVFNAIHSLHTRWALLFVSGICVVQGWFAVDATDVVRAPVDTCINNLCFVFNCERRTNFKFPY